MKLKLEATKTNKESIDSRKQLIPVLFLTQWLQDKRQEYTLEGSPTHNLVSHTQTEG